MMMKGIVAAVLFATAAYADAPQDGPAGLKLEGKRVSYHYEFSLSSFGIPDVHDFTYDFVFHEAFSWIEAAEYPTCESCTVEQIAPNVLRITASGYDLYPKPNKWTELTRLFFFQEINSPGSTFHFHAINGTGALLGHSASIEVKTP